MTCQYFPWCPSCRTTECFDLFDENPFLPPSGFWSYKETNWPSETPAFDAEWNFNAGRVEFSNKGAFTRVFDTQDPMASYSLAMFEAQFVTNSLTSGSECGVTLMMPWEAEAISLWWMGGDDFELRKGESTVLEAFTVTGASSGPFVTLRITLLSPKNSVSDVECWINEQLVHTELGVAWSKPELLDYGVCVDGNVDLESTKYSPCGLACITESECGVDTKAPELWTLQCPPIIQKPKHDPATDTTIHCQEAISEFFPGGHTLIRQFAGKTQSLVRNDTDPTCYPVEYEWQQCEDLSDAPGGVPCSWVAVITESMSLGVAPYLCYQPRDNPDGFCPDNPGWNCNMVVVNNRDSTYFPISSKGSCPAFFDASQNEYVLTDDWFGPTSLGNCDGGTLTGPQSETWRIYIRFFNDVPQWQRDQETVPDGGFQVVAFANFNYNRTQPVSGQPGVYEPVHIESGVLYYSDWYTVAQPIPSSAQITLERGDIRYPVHPGWDWETFYTFPDEITANPNGTGDNDSYTRYCRGLTCQPILDPEEDTEYTFTMTYELPDESLLVDEPTVFAYFSEDDDSWQWYGFGQPISLIDCPELGAFFYHIHCIKEANGGRGQWVLDVTNADNATSRLLMIVDEELGITFEGTVISGCDGQNWDGIADGLQVAPNHIDRRFGSCRGVSMSGTFGITCDLGGSANSSFHLRSYPNWTVPPLPDNYALAGSFKLGNKWFAIAAWASTSNLFEVEIREGMLQHDPLSAIGTNWGTLPFVWNFQDEYVCHPGANTPMLPPLQSLFSYFMVDTFGVCPNTGGFAGGELSISWG